MRLCHPVFSFHGKQKRGSGCSDRFNFGVSKITVDGDCCHEIKTLDLGSTAMTKVVCMHAHCLFESV